MPFNIDFGLKNYLLAGLGAALLLSNVGWYIAYDLCGDKLVAEKTAHEKTKSNYKQAQIQAEADSLKNALEKERKYAENASKADESYKSLYSKYNASLLRYQAAQRASSTIHLSGTTETTDGSYSSSDSTDILITISDAQICSENTARLQAVQEWTKTLKQ